MLSYSQPTLTNTHTTNTILYCKLVCFYWDNGKLAQSKRMTLPYKGKSYCSWTQLTRLVSSYDHIRQSLILELGMGAQSVNIHSRVPTNTHIIIMVTLAHLRFIHLAVHRSWPWWLLGRFLRLGIQVTCGGGSLALYGAGVLVGSHLYSWFLLLVSGWFLRLGIQVTRGGCLALYGAGVLVHGTSRVARLACLHILLLGLFTIRF